MSSPDQRKSGTGKKSEHSTVASSPRSHPPAVDSSPSRSSSTKKRSSDDEVSDEDEAEAEGDEEGTSMPSKHRRGRDAHKPTLRTAINFTQLLVFGCLMLLGLNLFIAYHNMLITQPILFQLETQVPAIESAVEALATQLEELQQAIEQLREGGFSSADVETPQDTTELIETEEAEPPAEPEEDDSSAPFTTDYISSEDWSIDYEALDKLILQQMGRDIAEAEAKTAYWGGNNMMLLTPEDIAALNVYQNWSQTVHADGSITASNAGSSHNRTAVFLLTIGQLDPITLTPRDIILLNPDSADRIAVASRAIKKDEVFWRADRKHCLTTQIAEESDVGQVLKDHPRLGDEMIVLTVFLLYERTQNPRSPLKFWYDMLPASFAFMPTMYSPDDLTMIENTLAADQIFQYQLNYREEYLALSVALEDFARKFSFAQYCWARYAIATRAFDVSMGKELIDPKTGEITHTDSSTTGLAPLDIVNHQIHESLVTALWGFDQENQQMAYTAAKDIAEGEEIFTHYGDRGTTALLTNYGFTAGGNPYDFTGLCLAPEKDATEEDKTAMLTAIYNYGNPFDTACASRLPMDSPNGGSCNLVRDVLSEDSHKCWQFARIASAEPEQVSRLMEKHNADVTARENMDEEELAAYEWSVLDTEWSDYENELRALGFLANSAVFQHALIPGGSTAEDAAQLQAHEAATAGKQCQGDASTHAPAWYPAGPCLTSSQVNLVRLRASEKFPLENLIKLHEVALEFNILQPTTAAAAYEFLNSPHVVYSPAEKDSLSRNGLIEQDFSLPRRYLNDILIPAYVQLRGLPEEAQADVKTEL